MSASSQSTNGPTGGRLAIALVVRDEESTLPATLASVQPIADQLVVVDTGSRDRSREIAGDFGAQVIEHTWADSFAAARNAAWEAIQADWVLWVDAGETLPAADAQSLRAFALEEADPDTIYSLWIELPPAAPGAYVERAARLRLMTPHPELRYTGRVSESVAEAAAAIGRTTALGRFRLLRSGREHETPFKSARAQRNRELVDKALAEEGRQPRLLIAAAEALSTLGDHAAASTHYGDVIKHESPDETSLLEAYYGLLTTLSALGDQGRTYLNTCMTALEKFPLDAQLLCALGGAMQTAGRLDMAARAFDLALKHGDVNPQTWHVRDVSEMAAICLAAVQQLQDQPEQAAQSLAAAVEAAPTSERLRRALIDVYIRLDKQHDALAQIDGLPRDLPHRDALRNVVPGACQVGRQNWIPALAYLQSAYSSGCRDSLCLRWLATALVSTGCRESSQPVLEEWLAIEPHNAEARGFAAALQEPAEDAAGAVVAAGSETQAVAPSSDITRSIESGPTRNPAHDDRQRRLRIDTSTGGSSSSQPAPANATADADDTDEAALRESHRQNPGDPRVAAALSELLINTRRVQEGLELALPLVSSGKVDPGYREFTAGLSDFRGERFEEALAHFVAAREAGYDRPLLVEYAAGCYTQLARYDEAEPLWRELLLRDPGNTAAYHGLARVLAATGRQQEADVVLSRQEHTTAPISPPNVQPGSQHTV